MIKKLKQVIQLTQEELNILETGHLVIKGSKVPATKIKTTFTVFGIVIYEKEDLV